MCKTIALLFGALTLAATGCGSASSKTLKGTVTANGKPVESGYVIFMPLDETNRSYGAPIEDGKFSARIAPGKYRVTVAGGAKERNFPKSQEALNDVTLKDLAIKDQVPNNATGNGIEVEIDASTKDLPITLEFSTR